MLFRERKVNQGQLSGSGGWTAVVGRGERKVNQKTQGNSWKLKIKLYYLKLKI